MKTTSWLVLVLYQVLQLNGQETTSSPSQSGDTPEPTFFPTQIPVEINSPGFQNTLSPTVILGTDSPSPVPTPSPTFRPSASPTAVAQSFTVDPQLYAEIHISFPTPPDYVFSQINSCSVLTIRYTENLDAIPSTTFPLIFCIGDLVSQTEEETVISWYGRANPFYNFSSDVLYSVQINDPSILPISSEVVVNFTSPFGGRYAPLLNSDPIIKSVSNAGVVNNALQLDVEVQGSIREIANYGTSSRRELEIYTIDVKEYLGGTDISGFRTRPGHGATPQGPANFIRFRINTGIFYDYDENTTFIYHNDYTGQYRYIEPVPEDLYAAPNLLKIIAVGFNILELSFDQPVGIVSESEFIPCNEYIRVIPVDGNLEEEIVSSSSLCKFEHVFSHEYKLRVTINEEKFSQFASDEGFYEMLVESVPEKLLNGRNIIVGLDSPEAVNETYLNYASFSSEISTLIFNESSIDIALQSLDNGSISLIINFIPDIAGFASDEDCRLDAFVLEKYDSVSGVFSTFEPDQCSQNEGFSFIFNTSSFVNVDDLTDTTKIYGIQFQKNYFQERNIVVPENFLYVNKYTPSDLLLLSATVISKTEIAVLLSETVFLTSDGPFYSCFDFFSLESLETSPALTRKLQRSFVPCDFVIEGEMLILTVTDSDSDDIDIIDLSLVITIGGESSLYGISDPFFTTPLKNTVNGDNVIDVQPIQTDFPTESPSPAPTDAPSRYEISFEAMIVDTATRFALNFSDDVEVLGNLTFRCNLFFEYLFDNDATCKIVENLEFPRSTVFISHNSTSVDFRVALDEPIQFALVEEKFSSVGGNYIVAARSEADTILPPFPVSVDLVDNVLRLNFDRSVKISGVDGSFYCIDLFFLFPFYPNTYDLGDIMSDGYICEISRLEGSIMDISFVNFVPYNGGGVNHYVSFEENVIGKVLDQSGIGSVFGEVFLSTNNEQPFSFLITLLSLEEISVCNDEIIIKIEQNGLLSYFFEVFYTVSVLEFNKSFTTTGSIITSLSSIFNELDELREFEEDYEYNFGNISIEGAIQYPYGTSVFQTFAFEFTYVRDFAFLPIIFPDGDSKTIYSVEPFKLVAELGTLGFGCTEDFLHAGGLSNLNFHWKVNESEVSSTSNIFSTTPGELSPGLYNIQLTVNPRNDLDVTTGFGQTFKFFQLTVLPTAPVLKLPAETITVNLANETIISAGRSCKPTADNIGSCDISLGFLGEEGNIETIEELGFTSEDEFVWSCLSCEEENEVVFIIESNPLTPILSNLAPNQDYEIQLAVVTADDNIEVEPVSMLMSTILSETCLLPEVQILPMDPIVNVGDFTVFTSITGIDVDELVVEWSIFIDGEDRVEIPRAEFISTRKDLFVPREILLPGERFLFQVNVTNICFNETLSASTEVSTFINSAPSGGVTDVTLIGSNALLPVYTLEASLWVDVELNIPMQFSFEYLFVSNTEFQSIANNPDAEFLSSRTIPLTSFSSSTIARSPLPLAPEGFNLVVISVARDSLGAVSRRFFSNAATAIPQVNPFVDESGEFSVNVSVGQVEEVLDEVLNLGQPEKVASLCSVIASSLNDANSSVDTTSTDIRELCFSSTANALDQIAGEGAVDISVLNSVASSFNLLTSAGEDLSPKVLSDFSSSVESLTRVLISTVSEGSRGENDPKAGSILDNSVRENIFGVLSNSVNLLSVERNPVTSNSSRSLQEQISPCDIALDSENIMRLLSNLSNSVVGNGAPAYEVETENIHFVTSRERNRDIGRNGRLQDFNFEGTNNKVSFGQGVSQMAEKLFPDDEDVNVYAVKWDINIRCDRSDIFFPDGYCQPNMSYSGPYNNEASSISKTISVEILTRGEKIEKINVENINDTVSLVLDVHESYSEVYLNETCQDKSECEITLGKETVCGAFAERLDDWTSDGCEIVTDAHTPPGTVLCNCSHLSYYGSWEAFEKDIFEIGDPVVCESEFANLQASFGFSLYFLFCGCLFGWATLNDKTDSNKIMKASVARITLLRIIKKHKKKKYFRKLRDEAFPILNDEPSQLVTHRGKLYWLKTLSFNFIMSLRYEHSIFSIGKFDPHYSKVQRIAVFCTVVLANFAVSAVFYNLVVEGDDLPPWFILIVGVVCALCVGFPVKVLMKILFRSTENKIGSVNDICANSNKILLRLEKGDGNLLRSDEKLVDSYRRLLWASQWLERNQAANYSLSQVKRNSDKSLVKNVEPWDEEEAMVEIEYEAPNRRTISPEELKTIFNEVKVATVEARRVWHSSRSLNSQTPVVEAILVDDPSDEESAPGEREIPVAFYTMEWERVILAESQGESRVKRLAALIADTSTPKARPRTSLLPSSFNVLTWLLLAMLVIGLSYLSIDFIIRRFQDIAREGKEDGVKYSYKEINEIRYLESVELENWVFASLIGIALSYLVAEPLALFLRFFLAPMFLILFGESRFVKTEKEPLETQMDRTTQALEKMRDPPSVAARSSGMLLDFMADFMENVL
eukprot:snap_masked-scaffold_24-processed-gene-0.18-mRNA-1 protein AED:1.00 eAED:1.00 QI:0/-1/0/0/-1/1/1/0/2476